MHTVMAPQRFRVGLKFAVGAALAVAAIVASIIFLSLYWPFSRRSVLNELGEASETSVAAAAYHGTYFPRPGCVLEHVTFQHNAKAGAPPLITIDSLKIEGSFWGLFTKHLKRIRAEGMHLLIPARGSEHFQTPQRSSFVIDDLTADGASLQVASQEPAKQPTRFSFRNFAIHEVGGNGPASFEATFSNPEPPGEISTTGNFGPWNESDVGKTPVSGKYSFKNADLGVFGGIAGIFSSSGTFSGMLNHIEAQGQVDAPQFTVTSSSHDVQLRTDFRAVVNGENGDTLLESVTAHFLKTTIWSGGSVAGQEGQNGKTTSLEVAAKDGRIQDLLLLFTRSERAPMAGMVSFRAKVAVPPGKRPFLEKVQMEGNFGIDDGTFTKADTQEGVNHLSHGAVAAEEHPTPENDKDKSETVLSNLKGHVLLKNGTATFSDLSFSVPGALAQLQGTYNLITEKVNLHGTLKTDSEPAKSTSGIKTVMLRILEPFFKKKHRGYVMPVKITGTYRQPSFGLDLGHGDDDKTSASRIATQSGR